jgi:RHH-type transcriptional regulator, rel operon repressor / antitoxin RelB
MATSIRLSADLEKRLDNLAEMTGRTKAYYIREMIESSIDDLEAAYRADATLERIRKGEERVYSLEEVMDELGLDR